MDNRDVRICIVQPSLNAVSETFIRAHAEHLPGEITVVHTSGQLLPNIGNTPVLSQSRAHRVIRKMGRLFSRRSWEWEITSGYLEAFRRCRADVVLAEYGPRGVAVLEPCQIAGIPLVVHFHGFDASRHDVLKQYRGKYQELFQSAAAVVAVSHKMKDQLLALGADPSRTFLNVYGIDCSTFIGAKPDLTPPVFLSVGRFVEKKAPHLTLMAFAEVHRRAPQARLRMIGEGALLGPCRDLAVVMGLEASVDFLGAQSHEVVANEMKNARAFVQHSVEAWDGDCEGTPLAVMEAGACGLPVVSTYHAGIPDIVIHGQTGFLVNERDVMAMADHMTKLAEDPRLAGQMGNAARERITTRFTMEQSIQGLYKILCDAALRKHTFKTNPAADKRLVQVDTETAKT